MSARLPFQAAFLTGRSDPRRCALSPLQRRFVDRLELPRGAAVPLNFPYEPGPPYGETPLLLASFHNARIYLEARRPGFAERHAGPVRALLGRAEHTVFLAGSCGLELLAGLRLEPEVLERVSVFAYGPVARAPAGCRVLTVQGERDAISRWWLRKADHRVPCGHMDYLSCPEVLTLCREFIRTAVRTGNPSGGTCVWESAGISRRTGRESEEKP